MSFGRFVRNTGASVLMIAAIGAFRGETIEHVAPERAKEIENTCLTNEYSKAAGHVYNAVVGMNKGLACLQLPGIRLERMFKP